MLDLRNLPRKLDSLEVGGDTNYADFTTDGVLTFYGDARVKRHLILDPKRFQMPAANYPGESFEGLYYTMNFDKGTEESAYCQEHVPYRWDSSTDIEIVVSWFHDGVDAGVVVWGAEYKSITAGEAVTGAGTTITQASTGTHTAGVEVRTAFTTKILHGNLAQDDDFVMRFYRDADAVADTLNEDARLLNVHITFTQNALGEAI